MLDKQDIELFEGLLDKRFAEQDRRQTTRLKDLFETYKKDTIAEMRDETRSLILASERRVKHEILTGVAEMLDVAILPHIARHDQDIDRINMHLKLA